MAEAKPQIWKALATAQAAMANASKDAKNSHFKSKYADLASVREAVMGPLTENGFAVVQQPETDDQGAVFVRTILAHESGEQIKHDGPHVMPAKRDAQGVGSAITYLRRYNLMAVCGIAPEDDDGNAASFEPTAGRASQNNAPRQTEPAAPASEVTAKKRAEASKLPPEAFGPAKNRGQNDDPLFVPVPTKQGRNGKTYHDWDAWKKALAVGADAAFEGPVDTVDALNEFFEANAQTIENYSHTDVGQNGGYRSFITWRESVYAKAGGGASMEAAE